MLNVFSAEIIKSKQNKIILISFLLSIIFPILFIVKDFYYVYLTDRIAAINHDPISWATEVFTFYNFLIMPVLTGFIFTFLIQSEYEQRTLINILTVPVSRGTLILGKVFFTITWYMLSVFTCMIITLVGTKLLYPISNIDIIKTVIVVFIKGSVLCFITVLPIMWIAIMQKKTFYPSLLVTLLLAIMYISGTQLPGILPALLPWSASYVLSVIKISPQSTIIGLTSILIYGILGIVFSIYTFERQDI